MLKSEIAYFGASWLLGVAIAWMIATLMNPLFSVWLRIPVDMVIGGLCVACAMVVLSRFR